MPCRLIINADDFGWSPSVNEAIVTLHDAGIVTSTSLMVGAPAADEAVSLGKERPALGVGLHLTLAHGHPVLPRSKIPALVDGDGRLSQKYTLTALRYTLLPHVREQMRSEAEAQFKAFAATGLPWSHVDGHVHFTLTPVVFRAALELASRYRVPGFRVPHDDFRLYTQMDPADARAQRSMARWFEMRCAPERRILVKAGFTVPSRCYGLFRTGRLDVPYLVRLVESLPDGNLELHCHPDLGSAEGRVEFEALRSQAFRGALAARSVVLTDYHQLGRKT